MAFNWSGAATGGGIGFAVGGPPGALVGAGIGGLGGGGLGLPDPLGDMFGMKSKLSTPNKDDFKYKGMAEGGFQSIGQQMYDRAPVQANLAQANESRALGMQSREGITDMQKRLGALVNDDKASAAYRQMQAGGDQNMRQALALSRSAGGTGGAQGAALRQAQMGNTVAGQQLNQQTGIMRAQETAQANAQLAGLATQQRTLDLQAQGLDAQTAMQQAQLELGSQQLGTQGLLGMYGLGQNAAGLEQKGSSDYWKTLLGAEAAQMQAEAQAKAGLMGGIGAIGGGLIAGGVFSDVSAKTNIVPQGTPAQVFGMPGQPQITTGNGGMVTPSANLPGTQSDLDAMSAQRGMQGFNAAQNIYQAFQPKGPGMTGMRPVESYLPSLGFTDSDARAKTLQTENDALKYAMAAMSGGLRPAAQGGMQRGLPAAAPRVQAATASVPRVRPMTGAEQKELDWAVEDALAGNFVETEGRVPVRRFPQDQRGVYTGVPGPAAVYRMPEPAVADALRLAEQKVAQPPAMTDSDEKSKQRIQELEGMVASLAGNPGGRYVDLDAQEDPTAAEVARPARARGIEPRQANVRFDLGQDAPPFRSGFEQQLAAVPNYTWQYDDEHAVKTNAKAGLPADAPFGFEPKTGPMAQDLQRLPALRGAVTPGPDGLLQIDGGQVAMTTLAGLGEVTRHAADLEERLRGLEATRKSAQRGAYPTPKGTR